MQAKTLSKPRSTYQFNSTLSLPVDSLAAIDTSQIRVGIQIELSIHQKPGAELTTSEAF